VKAALRLGPDEAFRRLSAAFRAKDRDGKVGLLRLAAAVEGIGSSPSPQWTELLLKAFSSERSPKVQAMLARSLGVLGDRRAVPPLLKLLGNAKGDLQGALIQALGTLKDPVAIDPLIELCEGNGGWWVRSAILEINDVAAVDKVRSLVAKKKQPDWVLRSLLTALERRFPGA
jgi:HEAT repeat protein